MTKCEDLNTCSECVESELNCKFCPSLGCVVAHSKEPCSQEYVTSKNEDECPTIKAAAGSALTPFACIIVLLSFLVTLL